MRRDNACMSDRIDLENALLRIEAAARDALHLTIDTEEGQELRDALDHLDVLRTSIRLKLAAQS